MASTSPVLLRLISSSIAIANHAGNIIRDVMAKGELGIVQKGVNDPQTEADRRAQQCIIGSLMKQFPRITIIGEENLVDQSEESIITEMSEEILKLECPEDIKSFKEEDLVVWVDPLDGTSEYTQGNLDHVTVLIGVAHKNTPVGGVIHQPYHNYTSGGSDLGRTLWGIPGIGCGGFKPLPPPEGRRVIATTRSHMTDLVLQTIEALKPDEVLKVGGAGFKVLMVMEGKATAYVFASAGCNKWDTCAPEAILAAMGGRLTDIHGKPYSYAPDAELPNKRGVLATTLVDDHQWFVDTVPESVKKQLV